MLSESTRSASTRPTERRHVLVSPTRGGGDHELAGVASRVLRQQHLKPVVEPAEGAELDRLEGVLRERVLQELAGVGVPGVRRRVPRTSGARRGGRRGRRRPPRPRTGVDADRGAVRLGHEQPPGHPPDERGAVVGDRDVDTASDGRRTWRGARPEVSTLPSSARRPSCVVAIQASQRPSGDQLSSFTIRRWLSSAKARTERPGLEVHQGEVGARLGGCVLVGDRPPVAGQRERDRRLVPARQVEAVRQSVGRRDHHGIARWPR